MSVPFSLEPFHDPSRTHRIAESRDVAMYLLAPGRESLSSFSLRVTQEGNAEYFDGTCDSSGREGTWWRFCFEPRAVDVSYRFVVECSSGTRYVCAGGVRGYEPPDTANFRLVVDPVAPEWTAGITLYQIFLDRFWRSGRSDPRFAAWTDEVLLGPTGVKQFFGGDLGGIVERLDHVCGLGAGGLCLTPFFPSPESHRYAASTFDSVDPTLGGDEALRSLTEACRARDLKCLGDLTLNHCGASHHWFRTAQTDQSSPEAGMFAFTKYPDQYATFSGVRTLPKLNYSADITRWRMYLAPDSALRTWMRPPYLLDGWRVDVGAMVGRLGTYDDNHRIAQQVRRSIAEERRQGFLFAEIPHDPGLDVGPQAWPGAWLDAAFASPVRAWLRTSEPIDGYSMVHGLREHAGRIPWLHLLACVGIVGSHDHPRLMSVVGSTERVKVALFLLLTFPSIPMLFAGDEYGVRGETAEEGRAPMPWPDTTLRSAIDLGPFVARLAHLRRDSPALSSGGLRWLAANEDAVAYMRRHEDEQIVCVAARDSTELAFAMHEARWEPVTDGCPHAELRDGKVRIRSSEGRLTGMWRLL